MELVTYEPQGRGQVARFLSWSKHNAWARNEGKYGESFTKKRGSQPKKRYRGNVIVRGK